MVRILNAEPLGYSPKARAILETLGQLDQVTLDPPGLLNRVGAYDVLIVRLGFQIDRETMDAAPDLRAIVTATTGLDHIDIGYAACRGVSILSLNGGNGLPAHSVRNSRAYLGLIASTDTAHPMGLGFGTWRSMGS